MHEDYDEMLERYEKDGVIPVAQGFKTQIVELIQHQCPWCKEQFVVYLTDHVHCPYCCMEMLLDWSGEND